MVADTNSAKIETKIEKEPSIIEDLWKNKKNRIDKTKISMIIVSLLAIGLSMFHVYTAGFGTLSSWSQRSIHVIWAVLLIFMLFPFKKGKRFGWIDVLLILVTLVVAGYIIFFPEEIQARQGNANMSDLIMGSTFILLIIEATRRTNGLLMGLIGLFAVVYILFGEFFPGVLAHPGVRYGKMIDHMFNGTLGIFSDPIYVSSTVLILFVIFGAFLMRSGGGQFFTDFSFSLFGNKTGGPALSAVGSSAMVGMITGNGAANAAITGSFTIPLMKKLGYSKRFAGAVEAVASQGGQVMPPIMGASVFIMAEATGVPYIELALYALIPATIYFLIASFVVYFHSKKLQLSGIPKEQLPNVGEILFKQGYLFLPIVVIILLMVYGYSPMKAGFYAILLTVVLSWVRKQTRMNLLAILSALENGAKGALTVIAACATAGIIVGAVSLTGLGMTFSRFIINLAGGNLLLLLIFVAIASIILGMGMPTVSAYVILSVLGVPALIDLGVNVVAAHMFVFYFGVMSGLTPPVAITAYTTAGIAGSPPQRTALYAMRIGLGGFFIPFIFVYNPVLLLQGDQNVLLIITAILTAVLSCYLFSSALESYWLTKLNIVQTILLIASAVLLVFPGLLTDAVGIVVALLMFIWNKKALNNEEQLLIKSS